MLVTKDEIFANKDRFTHWNYEVPEGLLSATGYEGVAELEKYSSAFFREQADDEMKQRIIKETADIYERMGIYPIRYFSHNGILSEIRKAIAHEPEFKGDVVSAGASVGTTLCNFMFPNLHKTPSGHDIDADAPMGQTAWDKFYSREWLERIISYGYHYDTLSDSYYPSKNLTGGIRMTGSVPTNFRPMNARAIFERFTDEGDRVWDYASGFGGRMLGALSSGKDLTYIGTDPNSETMYNLHRLGEYIEMETGRQNSYELFCQGSEEYEGDKRSINFAFASPPYFSLEMYGVDGGDFNNAEQCWQKFPELEEWLEGYVRPTIKNLYRVLKRFSAYAVNIADFKIGNTQVNYVDEWKRISIEEGFTFEKNLYLGARARTGSALLSASVPGMGDLGSMKTENIMVFSK